MKICACCKVDKSATEFVTSKSRKDGFHPYCKPCHAEKSRQWVAANKAKRDDIRRAWQDSHKEQHAAAGRSLYNKTIEKQRDRSRQYREKNAVKIAERQLRWGRAFPWKRNAITAKRRAVIKQAMPAWANEVAIQRMYRDAKVRTTDTGIEHHVDHIVPLQGRNVCGLHVQDNLRVITKRENQSKSNRLIEVMSA